VRIGDGLRIVGIHIAAVRRNGRELGLAVRIPEALVK
jgi:hypothetical protein|tara:strand:+ start:279 stop:389 length:111 start_codon:yes stop_codon:yes gene_type:complete